MHFGRKTDETLSRSPHLSPSKPSFSYFSSSFEKGAPSFFVPWDTLDKVVWDFPLRSSFFIFCKTSALPVCNTQDRLWIA